MCHHSSQKSRINQFENDKCSERKCLNTCDGVDQVNDKSAQGTPQQGENNSDAQKRTGQKLQYDAAVAPQRVILKTEPGILFHPCPEDEVRSPRHHKSDDDRGQDPVGHGVSESEALAAQVGQK